MPLLVDLDAIQSSVFREISPGVVLVLAMGRGTGKTFLDRLAIHSQALAGPPKKIGLLLPSLKQAKRVFWPQLLEDCGGPLRGHTRTNSSDLTISYSNGSLLSTWGAENAQSIRGQRFDVVVEDECDDIDPATETAVVQPTFSRSGRNAIWIKSGTPRRGRHGILFRDFELGRKQYETASLRYRSFRFKSSESPQVDQEWLASVKAITDPAVYAREYECDFDSGEGLVYQFEEEFHVRQPPDLSAFSAFFVGVDHGWVDPGVLLLGGVQGHGEDATLWILQEHYESQCPNDRWDERAKSWAFAKTFFCDPSRPDRINDLQTKAQVMATSADNNIHGGLARVADLMFRRSHEDRPDYCRLYIAPGCKNTIRELNTYRRKRDPHAADQFLEDPEDKNNHAMDALRYLAVGIFGRGSGGRHVTSGR
jgi:hypothetical protein